MTIAEVGLASWPVCATIAAAAATARVLDSRRRGALNRALHELRRPLQALVLSSGREAGPGAHALRVAVDGFAVPRALRPGTRARRVAAIHAGIEGVRGRDELPSLGSRDVGGDQYRHGELDVLPGDQRIHLVQVAVTPDHIQRVRPD